MRKRKVLATGATAVLVAVAGLAAPASAESVRVVDGHVSEAAVDLLRVRVAHGPKQVRVRMVHDNLVRSSLKAGQSVSVFIDTDPADAGPEYRFMSGLNNGTDYVLQRVDRWAGRGRRLTCNHRFSIDWKKDVTVLRIGRGCLGRPETVAVAVKAQELSHEGERYVDWMLGRRRYTPAVAAG